MTNIKTKATAIAVKAMKERQYNVVRKMVNVYKVEFSVTDNYEDITKIFGYVHFSNIKKFVYYVRDNVLHMEAIDPTSTSKYMRDYHELYGDEDEEE